MRAVEAVILTVAFWALLFSGGEKEGGRKPDGAESI